MAIKNELYVHDSYIMRMRVHDLKRPTKKCTWHLSDHYSSKGKAARDGDDEVRRPVGNGPRRRRFGARSRGNRHTGWVRDWSTGGCSWGSDIGRSISWRGRGQGTGNRHSCDNVVVALARVQVPFHVKSVGHILDSPSITHCLGVLRFEDFNSVVIQLMF